MERIIEALKTNKKIKEVNFKNNEIESDPFLISKLLKTINKRKSLEFYSAYKRKYLKCSYILENNFGN